MAGPSRNVLECPQEAGLRGPGPPGTLSALHRHHRARRLLPGSPVGPWRCRPHSVSLCLELPTLLCSWPHQLHPALQACPCGHSSGKPTGFLVSLDPRLLALSQARPGCPFCDGCCLPCPPWPTFGSQPGVSHLPPPAGPLWARALPPHGRVGRRHPRQMVNYEYEAWEISGCFSRAQLIE